MLVKFFQKESVWLNTFTKIISQKWQKVCVKHWKTDPLKIEQGVERLVEEEALKTLTVPEINSKRQYEAEREAGDPNALKLSFDEWKQL